MIKYKIDVGDALERVGFTTYRAKTTGLLSQDTLRRIKEDDTNISIKSLNSLCLILDLQPKDILIYEDTEQDRKQREKI